METHTMSDQTSFVKCLRGEKTDWLRENHPWAFLLLGYIADKAIWVENHPSGLQPGEVEIGNFKKCGIPTEGIYRSALKQLLYSGKVEKVTSNRNCKNTTTSRTTSKTVVRLISSDVYDININLKNDLSNDLTTTSRRPRHSTHIYSKEGKEREEGSSTKNPPSSDLLPTPIYFSLKTKSFDGITNDQLDQWQRDYAEISVRKAMDSIEDWYRNNPQAVGKIKNWQRAITKWLSEDNEKEVKAKQDKFKGTAKSGETKDVLKVARKYNDRLKTCGIGNFSSVTSKNDRLIDLEHLIVIDKNGNQDEISLTMATVKDFYQYEKDLDVFLERLEEHLLTQRSLKEQKAGHNLTESEIHINTA